MSEMPVPMNCPHCGAAPGREHFPNCPVAKMSETKASDLIEEYGHRTASIIEAYRKSSGAYREEIESLRAKLAAAEARNKIAREALARFCNSYNIVHAYWNQMELSAARQDAHKFFRSLTEGDGK